MQTLLMLVVALTLFALNEGAAAAPYALIPSDPACVTSLDGTWRFKLEQKGADTSGPRLLAARDPITTPETFESFYTPDYTEDASWKDISVPGNWEIAGFSPATYDQPDNASGFYREWFDVPASWKGREVRINFDGAMCGCEVWINGQPAAVSEPSWGRPNYHESGWTAWQADLTPHVRFGARNPLALRVTKNTLSSDLDSGDYYFLGGVYRSVTLFSVPKTHIRDLTVVTRLTGGGAEVSVTVDVQGPASAVRATLGEQAAVTARPRAGQAKLVARVRSPKLWSAEHPHLYPLRVELLGPGGKPIETITRRIGIREVTIEQGVLKLNGVPIKMTGICRHDIYLTKGTALNEAVWRKDLTLMKEANINAVRTSHYPYGSRFYDLCDEMGFYVLDELPYCWCPMDDAKMTPAFLQRARETIRRDKNHACVILWGIGNENRAGINQRIVADAVRKMDPTRPRLNSCRNADESGVEFDDMHYTDYRAMTRQATSPRRKTWPIIFTENPNVWDVRLGADYGCLDAWAEVLRRCWEDVTWTYPGVCGGFLWEWQDRAVIDAFPEKLYQYDPITRVNYVKTKGVVDGWRHPRPEYYHLKMVYSPILVAREAGFSSRPGFAVLKVTNRYQFTNLSEIRIGWQALEGGRTVAKGSISASMAPGGSGEIAVPLRGTAGADALRVSFDHPGGWNVVTCQFSLLRSAEPEAPEVSSPPDGLRFPALNLVTRVTHGDPYAWRVADRSRCILTNLDPPDLSGKLLSAVSSVEADIAFQDSPAKPVAHLNATCMEGVFSYRIVWTGPKTDIEQIGWSFEMPAAFNRFSWKRQALWSYYPDTHIGRPAGTATPDSADVRITNISRPDAFDFNSTKYDCDMASLTDGAGQGLLVRFDPDQRHHCRGGSGGGLVVNRQCSPPRDLSTHQVPEMYLELSAGDTVEGSFRIGSR